MLPVWEPCSVGRELSARGLGYSSPGGMAGCALNAAANRAQSKRCRTRTGRPDAAKRMERGGISTALDSRCAESPGTDNDLIFPQPSARPKVVAARRSFSAVSAGWMVVAVLLAIRTESVATTAPTNAPLAVWDGTARVTAGAGYRDNVLRTAIGPESSGFYITATDATLMRLSETGSQLLLLVVGEDVRYFDSASVPKEQVLSATATGSMPFGENNTLGALLQYLYQNQIMDASETEANLRRLLVEGHGLAFRPHWKRILRPGWLLQVEGSMDRQFYAGELDDFWEGAGRLTLTHPYGRRSEWSVSLQSKHRLYDKREQFNGGGRAITNTSLTYWRPEVSSQWRHYWDEGRHWRTTTKAGLLLNRDNGPGYFDYDRVQVAEQLRWANSGWDISAQARFGWYHYREQRIGNAHRERTYVLLDLRAERRLGKHWLLHAAAEREWNLSNDRLDAYNDWMVNGGIGIEF